MTKTCVQLRGLLCVLMLVGTLLGLFMSSASYAAQDDFLDPEKAFVLESKMANANTISLKLKIAKDYYMYRERFAVKLDTTVVSLGEPQFPTGEIKYDPTFDKKMVLYFKEVVILVPITAWPKDMTAAPFLLTLTGQGCAVAGICYPPMDFVVKMQVAADGNGYVVDSTPAQQGVFERLRQGQWSELLFGGNDLKLADVLASTGALEIVALFFLLGLLLALTPCVLPMLPILSVLLVGESPKVSKARGLMLAFGYVLGMSVVYTVLGVAAGLSGVGLAAWLQAPWVLATFALMLGALALAMFDVYTLQMPSGIQTRLMAGNGRLPGGKVSAAVMMGALSALIVGPCVAAPLAGALLYISQTGDVWLGGSALFAMAWGMGVPLLVMGASSGKLIPKTGPWMEGVKKFFGVLLFATAWWMVTPLIPTWLQIFGWATLAMFSAVMLCPFEPLPESPKMGSLLRKTVGLLLVVLSAIWFIGIASGGRSLLQPLSHLAAIQSSKIAIQTATTSVSQPQLGSKATLDTATQNRTQGPAAGLLLGTQPNTTAVKTPVGERPTFRRVHTLAELNGLLAQTTQPVMLDFYADWCVSCKEMEAFTFTDPRVSQRMSDMLLLKVDVTQNNVDDRELMKRFRLFGPPGIIFFTAGGQEIKDVRVVGFQEASRFAATLDGILSK